jgi:hypothetical protein
MGYEVTLIINFNCLLFTSISIQFQFNFKIHFRNINCIKKFVHKYQITCVALHINQVNIELIIFDNYNY